MFKAQLQEDLLLEEARIWSRVEAEMLETPNVYLLRLLRTRETAGSTGHPLRRTLGASRNEVTS